MTPQRNVMSTKTKSNASISTYSPKCLEILLDFLYNHPTFWGGTLQTPSETHLIPREKGVFFSSRNQPWGAQNCPRPLARAPSPFSQAPSWPKSCLAGWWRTASPCGRTAPSARPAGSASLQRRGRVAGRVRKRSKASASFRRKKLLRGRLRMSDLCDLQHVCVLLRLCVHYSF